MCKGLFWSAFMAIVFVFGAVGLSAQCPTPSNTTCTMTTGQYDHVVIGEVSGDSGQSDGSNDGIVEIVGPPLTVIGCMVVTNSEWAVLIPPGTMIPADGVFLIGCSTTDCSGYGCGTGINGNMNGLIANGEGDYNSGLIGEIDFDVCAAANAQYYWPAASGFTIDNSNANDGDQVMIFRPDGTPHDGIYWGNASVTPGGTTTVGGASGGPDHVTIQVSGQTYTLGDNDGDGIVNNNPMSVLMGRGDNDNATAIAILPTHTSCPCNTPTSPGTFTMPSLSDTDFWFNMNTLSDTYIGCNSSFGRIGTTGGSHNNPSHTDGEITSSTQMNGQNIDNGGGASLGTTGDPWTPNNYNPSSCATQSDLENEWGYTDHPTPGQPNNDPTFVFYTSTTSVCGLSTPVTFTVEIYNYQHVSDAMDTGSGTDNLQLGSLVQNPITGMNEPWTTYSVSGETTTMTYTVSSWPSSGEYTFNLVWDDFTNCCGSSVSFGNECYESQAFTINVGTPVIAVTTSIACPPTTPGLLDIAALAGISGGCTPTYQLYVDGTLTGDANTSGTILLPTMVGSQIYEVVVTDGCDPACGPPITITITDACEVPPPPCPTLSWAPITTPAGHVCPDSTLILCVQGTNLLGGQVVNFYNGSCGFDPYLGEGNLLGSSQVVCSYISSFVYDPAVVPSGCLDGNAWGNNSPEAIELVGTPGGDIGCWIITDGGSLASGTEGAIQLPPGTTIPLDGVFVISGGACATTAINAAYGVGTVDYTITPSDVIEAGLVLGNGGDQIILLNADGQVVDAVDYEGAGATSTIAFTETAGCGGSTIAAIPAASITFESASGNSTSGGTTYENLSDGTWASTTTDYFNFGTVNGAGVNSGTCTVPCFDYVVPSSSCNNAADNCFVAALAPQPIAPTQCTGTSTLPTLALEFTTTCPDVMIPTTIIDVCASDLTIENQIALTLSGILTGSGNYYIIYAINGVAQTPITYSGGTSLGTITIPSPTNGQVSITLVSVFNDINNNGIQDVGECTGTVNNGEVLINIRPTLEITISGSTQPTTCTPCNGTVTFDLVSGTSTNIFDIEYEYNGTIFSIAGAMLPYVLENVCPGSYDIINASDEFGCEMDVVSNIELLTVPSGVPIIINTQPAAICNDGTIEIDLSTIDMSPAYNVSTHTFYSADPNSIPPAFLSSFELDPLQSGFTSNTTIYVQYTDPSGCQTIAQILITVNPTLCGNCPSISNVNITPFTCQGNNILLISSTNLQFMSGTENGVADVGINFMYFSGSTPPSNPYIGGTVLGSVPYGNLLNNYTEAILNNTSNTLSSGIYTLCAILSDVTGFDIACRPSVCTTFEIVELPQVDAIDVCIGTSSVLFSNTGNTDGIWSVSGGGTINPLTGEFTPTTAGCFTATFITNNGSCQDADTFVVFPASPVLLDPTNTCNTAFALPIVTSVSGFTTEFSINGATFTATPILPSTPGCYSITARYVLSADCGTTLAGAIGSGLCGVSNTVSALIYPSEPVLTAPTNTCNAAFVLPAVTPVVGFTVQYSINGGAWATAPTIPTTPGCHTIATRYVNTAACGLTAALTPSAIAGCDASADVSVLIYPSEPVLTAPTNTCNAAFVLPAVTPVVGFTVQYSINGGAWATVPTIPTTPGCHTIAARYVNTAACGLTAALTPSTIAGCDASADVTVLIYPSEPVLTAPANTCNAAFVLPAVTPVVGFTVQYSINGGTWATAPAIPTTPGCHTIAARYVNTAACGLTAALAPSAIAGCDASADVSVLIYPSEPVLTVPANTCNAAFVLPAITPVVGFTVQYSINGGAWATAPTIPTTPGCHTIAARYVNTAPCGLTAALTPSTIAGCDASADVSVLIYPSEPVLTAPANTCNAAFVLPAVTPVVGFTVQYSINGGAWATAPAIPTTPGCHTISARYVNTAACGLTAALTSSAIAGCDASADVSVLIYPSEPVLTAPANTCNAAFVLPAVTPVVGFTVQYSINGGVWATAPTIPTTPGCHTIAARYVNTAACGLTAALTPSAIAGCDAGADVSVLIYPSEPVLTAPANTCNAAFVLPAVTPVVGFTVQYSINGGAWATAPTIPTTPGCHTIAARYVNTAACGLTAALTPSAIAGCDASADVSVLIYPSEPVLTAPANTCNAAFVLPAVTPVVGFTVQYSINGGAWATTPTIPTTPGCHTIAARYVNTAACGSTAALTPSAIAGCDASVEVSVLIYPSEPVLTAPTNTCNAAFVLPTVTPVVGFTIQYSINGGAWSTAPVIPTTPGCHTIAARYVNTAACGSTAALTPSTIAGCDATALISVVIFPNAPTITMPQASCMSDFRLPVVTSVTGFSVQYSVNGGAWTANPMTSMTPGCYSIQARYVLETACGSTPAGTPGTGSCGASNVVNTNVYPVPVIEPVTDVFMCDMSQVNVNFSSLTEILSCYGSASIQYQWTNNNTSIGLAASGTGNISFVATQPGTAFIIVTPIFTGPDGSCKGQPISFIISIHQETSIVCNDRVHVSLDENCEFNMSGDFILEGSYNEYFYNVVIKTSAGEIIDNSNVSLHIGEVLIAEVTDICNGNRCWGEVIFEDKLAPVVECNCTGPIADVSAFREIGKFGNKKYYLSNATYTWQQAYAHAQSVGGEMLCITSAAENAFILNTWTIPGFTSQRTWLGATDNETYGGTEANNTNNGWVWVSGEPFSYTNWASGEPNGLANEDYVEMFGTGGTEAGRWNDNTNTFGPLRYIMEIEDCTFKCYDLPVVQNETVPMLYGVSPNKSVLTTPPTATDGCGAVSATFTDAINGSDQCDTKELVRSWTFEDASGNKSYCTQRFAFEPISVTDLIPPVYEVHLTCGLDASPAAIAGYLDVDSRTQPASATNIGAYADDYAQTGSVVEFNEGYSYGYFTYQLPGYAAPAGQPNLHSQKVDNNVCNLYTSYTDDVIPACGIGCSGNMKVIRNWKLLDWCTGDVFTYIQVIKATDEKAPTFNVKNATVGVDPWGCAANWNVAQPWELADNCAKAEEIKWGVKVPAGVSVSGTAPNYRITGLTKGTHTITYWASDCCGNVSEKTATLTVIDASAPVAVAKQNIVMSLTGSGTGADGAGKIYGWQIDNGSYDHCSDVRFEVRRVDGGSCGNVGANGTHNNNSTYNDNNGYPSEVPGAVWFHPQDNAQDTDGGEFVKFCCEDIPAGSEFGLHDVELRVWDDGNMNGIIGDNDIINGMKDNYNTTWVTIRVENKLPPALVCPPDATITCDMELNLSLDAETNVNDVNLTMTGYPQAYDLCSNLQVTYKDQWVGQHDPVCKSGTVRRTFKVTKGSVVVTCTQFITVSTLTAPFTVTFPNQNQTTEWDKCNFTLDDARDAANASIKRPIVNYGQCDIVGENITIDTFLFEDGACKKWRVKYSYKNWCTGEEINTIAGLPIVHWYAFKDVTAPVLSCTNQMFAANPNPQNPNGGCEAQVALEASASDKLICAEESWIKWQMFFDGWNDGTVDRLGSSFVNKSWAGIWVPQAKFISGVLNPTWVALQNQHPNLPLADLVYVTYIKPTAASGGTAKLPVGTGATAFILNAENISHKVLWKVTDGCGNVDQCESTVMVVDKKAPTPYCVSVSTALMQTSPQMVELWARDFDKGAFDNCTPQSKLYFTFDGAAPIYSRVNEEHYYKVVGGVSVNATAAEYAQGKAYRWLPASRSAGFVWTAAGDYNVQVSVWDEAWNTDYCTVVLSVRGGNGSTPSSRVSGTVATESGQGVNDVKVTFDANMSEYPKTVQTTASGTFDMSNYNGLTYEITAEKGGDYLNGVSTLDLVMIQRHILGLQALDSNYKLIAADANNDGKVTASDLTDLRKLILGVTTTLPNNTSWKFPVAGTPVQTSPISCVELIEIENLSAEKANQNFVAVKIGDVNGNVSTSVNSPEVESRSNANVEMSVAEASIAAGEVVEIPVTAANFSEVSGFQYTMNLNGASFVGVQSGVLEVNANNVGVITDNVVTMSYASSEAVNANEGAVLFTLTVKADKAMKVSEMISLNSEVTRAESYNSDLKVGKVSLGVRTAPVAGIELFQNEPNPFKGMTTVSFEMPEAATATLSVYDVTGKVVTVRNINAVKGLNSEIFTKDQLGVSGVLYYTLVSGDFTATKKMIIVE